MSPVLRVQKGASFASCSIMSRVKPLRMNIETLKSTYSSWPPQIISQMWIFRIVTLVRSIPLQNAHNHSWQNFIINAKSLGLIGNIFCVILQMTRFFFFLNLLITAACPEHRLFFGFICFIDENIFDYYS